MIKIFFKSHLLLPKHFDMRFWKSLNIPISLQLHTNSLWIPYKKLSFQLETWIFYALTMTLFNLCCFAIYFHVFFIIWLDFCFCLYFVIDSLFYAPFELFFISFLFYYFFKSNWNFPRSQSNHSVRWLCWRVIAFESILISYRVISYACMMHVMWYCVFKWKKKKQIK